MIFLIDVVTGLPFLLRMCSLCPCLFTDRSIQLFVHSSSRCSWVSVDVDEKRENIIADEIYSN